MSPKPAAWKPESDEKPLTMQEFLALAERKHPGISRHPQIRQAINADLQKAVSLLPPVRARANARLRGYAPPLTDAEHTQAIKAHTGVRTYHRKNPGAGRLRRNYGPGNQAEVSSTFTFAANVYTTKDKAVTALRELIQNSADAINAPKTGSKALGQVPREGGRIDVTFDRANRSLTVEDNGSGMTPEIICKFTTVSGTTKGSTTVWGEEATEDPRTKYPPFDLDIRVFPRQGSESGPPDGGRYWVRINGLYQFDLDKKQADRILPADYILEYRSTGSAGGFGAAKAVIFLSSTTRPPRWEIHTQDNYYNGEMAWNSVADQTCSRTGRAPVRKVKYRQGTRFTVFDLDESTFDRVESNVGGRGAAEPIEYRMKRVLAANNLSGITITFNGEVVEPLFPAQGGGRLQFGDSGDRNWFDGIFKRPEQVPNPSKYARNYLVGSTSNPQDDAYQFTKGRDGFVGNALWGFEILANSLEHRPDALQKKPSRPNITFDPGDLDTQRHTPANNEIEQQVAQNLQSDAMQAFIQSAAEAAVEFSESVQAASRERDRVEAEAERKRKEEIRKLREQGEFSKAQEKEEELREQVKAQREQAPQEIGQGVTAAAEAAQELEALSERASRTEREQEYEALVERIIARLSQQEKERERKGLDSFARIAAKRGLYGMSLRDLRDALLRLDLYKGRDDARDILRWQAVLSDAALDGDGLTEITAINRLFSEVMAFCEFPPAQLRQIREEVGITNPFGASVALHVVVDSFTRLKEVEQRNWQGKIIKDDQGRPVKELEPVFDEARYQKFKRNYAKYVPLLLMWDQAVRQIIAVTNARSPIEGRIYTGFVLDDTAHAMYVRTKAGNHLLLVNPLLTAAVAKTFQTAGDFAAFIHAKAVHEIAHMVNLTEHKGYKDSHNEEFSITRESIGFRSVAVIPLIAVLAKEWTGLRNPYTKESVADMKKRYRKIAEDVTCGVCMKEAIKSLEETGRLDTVRWIRDRVGWGDEDAPRVPSELMGDE